MFENSKRFFVTIDDKEREMEVLFSFEPAMDYPGYEGRKYKKDNNRIRRSINIEEESWNKLQELAKQENRSASNLLEVMIKNWKKGE